MSDADLERALREQMRWRGDRTDNGVRADLTGWWRDPSTLRQLGPALARLHAVEGIDVVIGVESSGLMLGALVAAHLGVGLAAVRKDPAPAADSDQWLRRRMPPDYRDRQLVLGVRRRLIGAGQGVLFVDDWIATGAQGVAVRGLVDQAEARWVGAAVIVDALMDSRVRRDLAVRSLLFERSL